MAKHICSYCGKPASLGRVVMASGKTHVASWCIACGRYANPRQPYVSARAINAPIDELPIVVNNLAYAEPCAVKGCENIGTELHHFAPRHLFFERADYWPTAYLCDAHHREWHDKVTPTMKGKK
ncbi:MAG TPA: hypothetical protein VFM46_15610 [Pseudomonadales bacterium]|nr:hypothetical protein [Pseudomonadales bacterium]